MQIFHQLMKGKVGNRLFSQLLSFIDNHLKDALENKMREKNSIVSKRFHVVGVYSCSMKPNAYLFIQLPKS